MRIGTYSCITYDVNKLFMLKLMGNERLETFYVSMHNHINHMKVEWVWSMCLSVVSSGVVPTIISHVRERAG